MNYWIYSSGTGAAGWRRREKWSLGKKGFLEKKKSISVWQSCSFSTKLRSRSSTCIPCPGGRRRAGIVHYSHFTSTSRLRSAWAGLGSACTFCSHPTVGTELDPEVTAPQVPGGLHATQLSPRPWQTQPIWTSPGCWGKTGPARKTQTNKEADREEKEEL